jgi:flagellar hook-associated protein 1 FlgK
MRSAFSGLEIARRSLAAHQLALNVTGHNIANANTPGYTRQTALLRATSPYTVPGKVNPHGAGQIGTGVEVAAIRRTSDQFVQAEIVKEAGNTGYWQAHRQVLRQIEVALMEPSDSGVQAAFERYWAALQELHKSPDSHAVRSVLIEEARSLTDTIRYVRSQLLPLQRELDQGMRRTVDRINTLAEQIAAINRQIAHAQSMGHQPNDLFDQRDVLVAEVSRLTGATVAPRQNGMIAVLIGGVSLVDGAYARTIAALDDPGRPGFTRIVWQDTETRVQWNGGEMRSNEEARDQLIPETLERLDRLAAALIEQTNAVHRTGTGLDGSSGLDFFIGSSAADIAVNPEVAEYPERIGASLTGEKGDGTVALRMAQLAQEPVIDGATFENYFAGIVGRIGVMSSKAQLMVEHQADVEHHLMTLRQSVAGVNLDEEMTNMVMFQHAYAAAARVVNAMDEALETLIHRMGLVGR